MNIQSNNFLGFNNIPLSLTPEQLKHEFYTLLSPKYGDIDIIKSLKTLVVIKIKDNQKAIEAKKNIPKSPNTGLFIKENELNRIC